MKRFSLFVALFFTIVPTYLLSQANQVILPYRSGSYLYQFVKSNSTLEQSLSFVSPTASENGYSTGSAAFGTLNNTSSPPCPLNDTAHVKTFWPASRDLILRKHISLPNGAKGVVVSIALDNSVRAWFNGKEITNGLQAHNTCATENGDVVLAVPDSLVIVGDNLLAVLAIFNSSKNYYDTKITGSLPYTITASAGANGTISPSGTVLVFPGANQSFTITASTGYHVQTITVDGTPTVVATSLTAPVTTTYTFTSVSGNHSIGATFAINKYIITVTAGPNGSITPPGPDTVAYGSNATFTMQANASYHVDSLKIDTSAGVSVATSASTPSQTTYTFTSVAANHTIAATFAANKYTVSATVNPAGAGTVRISPLKALYNPGDTVVLTAFATKGYHFVQWSLPGGVIQLPNPDTIVITANNPISASFAVNVLQMIIVNTLTDDTIPGNGLTSLREAINIANGNPGGDSIAFDISVGSAPGSKIISLFAPLPPFNNPIYLDFSALLDANGKPLITLQPGYAPGAYPNSNGIDLVKNFLRWGYTPQGSIIRGLNITGFPGSGICIMSDSNLIQQNALYGNGLNGVCIEDGNGNAIGNPYGPANGTRGNFIYLNGRNGIMAKEISTADTIPPPAGNTFLGNSVYANGQLGIDLADDGVTPNKYQGGPTNPLIRPPVPDAVNYRVNYPTLNIATVGGANPSQIQGYYLSWRSTPFRIEAFLVDSANPSGYGEGRTFLGSTVVTTDNDSAYAWFVITSSVPLQTGQYVTATATDAAGNTSEFSRAFPVGLETRIFESDQYVINKTLSGIPLHWPDGQGGFSFANSVVSGGFQPAIESSFVAWNYQAVKPDHSPIVSYVKVPPFVTTEQWGGYPDGINNVVWVTNNWEQVTGSPSGAIAVTRVRYNALNGEMSDVDIAFNAQDFTFGDASAPGAPAGIKDMRDVATHEVGHYGGLGDIYVPGYVGWDIRMGSHNDSLTMYGIIRDNETLKTSLAQGDINGINYIYTHAPKSAVDLVMLIDGSAGFQAKYDGFNPSKMSMMEQVQRLRPNDRVAVIKLPDTVIVPLTKVDTTNMTSVLNAINAIGAGGTSNIGAGLQKGLNVLNVPDPKRPAMILFSAGEETGSPTAESLIPSLVGGSVPVFTFGFSGSSGQALTSQLADTTAGDYFLVADTTISLATHQIWNELTGFQQLGDTGVFAGQFGIKWQGGIQWQGGIKWQGGINWQGGIKWQGAVDPGTTSILPGINWQGSTFVLFLVPPGYPVPTGITDSASLPSYVITPSNLPPGATYTQGPNYAFYRIRVPGPGRWTLFPVGANTDLPPVNPEPVNLNLIATTDVVMNVTFDHDTYSPGNTIQMQAALAEGGALLGSEHVSGGEPITNATVTATVTLPGGSTQVVTLVHVGNGIYQGSFSNTNAPGTYDFKINATGATPTLPEGFTREKQQSIFVAPVYLNAVVFAQNSATLNDSTRVLSGNVFVNQQSQNQTSVQLTVGKNTVTPAGYKIKADHISIQTGSVINSDVYYNILKSKGTVNGNLFTPLTLPIGNFPPFITADSTTETAAGYTLGNGQTATLPPGIYGDVLVQPSSNLTLVSGVYQFRTLWQKSGSRVSCTGNGQVQIRVRRGLNLDNTTIFGPGVGSALAASDIMIYIAGTDVQSPFGYAANISPKSSIAANVYAANGTILLNQGTAGTGAFFAQTVQTGTGVTFSLSSAFNASASPRTAANGKEKSEAQAAEVPKSYELMQNYPNPFNPTTVIRYALPLQAHVTLSIYNVLGQEVARLVDGVEPQGYHEVSWNSRNSHGMNIGSGIYFYRITAGEFTNIKKMILLK